jgi:type VI secretion system protein VasG
VSLLDTACARVAISQHAVPPPLEDCRRKIEALQTELEIIGREETVGIDATERRKLATEQLTASEARRADLEQRWQAERELVDRILAIRAQLRKGSERVEGTGSKLEQAAQAQKTTNADKPAVESFTSEERTKLLAELAELHRKLVELQGESPLILPSVDEHAVASVVQDWTGIPVGRMVKNEVEAVLNLADTLNQRVIGQRHALEMIAKRIQTSRARLDNPNKPIGVFMLCGPSGVGKTETALALAEALYGGEHNVITINMSEFQEAHTVSTLKGAPPGYVGYGEGGVLTEAVRRRPYSVVLLDEVEKAHSDVHELFFQVFDKGWMEDGEGRRIDFKNTIILLTSNVGTELIVSMCKDPELMPEPEGIAKALREPLLKKFPAALLGRLVVIPYYPLGDAMLSNIARLQLQRIAKRIGEHHKIPFTYDDNAVKLIVSRCVEVESGGRMIDAILTNTVLPAVSREFLSRAMAGSELNGVRLSVADGDFSYRFE